MLSVPGHYAGVYTVLRRLLADHYLGGPTSTIRFDRHVCPAYGGRNHGRPRIARPATSPEFSLSRSGPHRAFAVTAAGSVDINLKSRHEFIAAGVSEVALSDPELGRMRAMEREDDRREFFLRSWTRKEAELKTVGIGIVTDLRSLDVLPADAGPAVVEHAGPGPRSRWPVTGVDLDPGRAAAPARGAGRRTGPVVLRAVGDARKGTISE